MFLRVPGVGVVNFRAPPTKSLFRPSDVKLSCCLNDDTQVLQLLGSYVRTRAQLHSLTPAITQFSICVGLGGEAVHDAGHIHRHTYGGMLRTQLSVLPRIELLSCLHVCLFGSGVPAHLFSLRCCQACRPSALMFL